MTITVQSHNAEADAAVNQAKAANAESAAGKEPSEHTAQDASVQNEASDSETEATEENESESGTEAHTEESLEAADETEAQGDSTETESETAKEKAPKKKGGFQKRIDKLNSRLAAKDQEAEYWKREAMKYAQGSGTNQAPEPKAIETASQGKPDPEKYASHAEWVEAVADWKADQKLREHAEKEARKAREAEQRSLIQTHQDRLGSFKEKHADFDEMMENLADVPKSPSVEHIIVSSQDGPELLYELAKNPSEAKRIATLPPLACAMEIGALRAKLASQKSSEAKKTETKRVSSAPNPIAPVGGGGKASAPPKTLEEAAKSSFAEYKRMRDEQLKAKRRRA